MVRNKKIGMVINKGNAWVKDYNCGFTHVTIHKNIQLSYIIKTIPSEAHH